MPEGVSASHSSVDKTHTVNGKSTTPKVCLLVLYRAFRFRIRIPLNFIINAVFFSIPWSYLEHIKVASHYHGRLSTVQDIWDQYTHQFVKGYQDFLLFVRLAHLSSSFYESRRLLCSYREYVVRDSRSTLVEAGCCRRVT